MLNKENEKITNSCEDSNSPKINDKGSRLLETAANAINSGEGMRHGNPDVEWRYNPAITTIYTLKKKTKEGQHLEYKKDDVEKEN